MTHGPFPARASGLRTTRALVGRKAGLKAKSCRHKSILNGCLWGPVKPGDVGWGKMAVWQLCLGDVFVASNFCFVVVGFFGEIRFQAVPLVCLKLGMCQKSEEIGSEIGHTHK